MTQIKRYDSKLECDHRAMSYAVTEEEKDDGEYVKYSDIQKVLTDLIIENAALKNSLDDHKDFIKTAVQNMGHILTPAAIQKLRELGFEQILKHPDAKSYFAFTENNPVWTEARKHRKDKSNYTLS
jgi:hypothetical protein